MHVFRWQFDIISARVSNIALTLSGLNSKNSRYGSRRNSRIVSKSENASVNETIVSNCKARYYTWSIIVRIVIREMLTLLSLNLTTLITQET